MEYSYFILPMNGPPTFGVIKSNIEGLLTKNQIDELELSIYLRDNYASFSSHNVDLKTDFIWSNSEIESVLFKIHDKQQQHLNTFEFNCDYLHHHLDVEDIAIESSLLNPDQIDLIKDSGYFFYQCWSNIDISKNNESALKLKQIIDAVGYLTNGMIFSVNQENWDVQFSPQIMNAKSQKNL